MLPSSTSHALFWLSLTMAVVGGTDSFRCIMYLTGQHNVIPELALTNGVTHVAIAFMGSDVFNVDDTPEDWPLFTSVEQVRDGFAPDTKIMVAIGGWGDNGFETAAKDPKRWARQVAAMVKCTKADGVDIDWEGNRDDYKQVPNDRRTWEIEAYVKLLEEVRAALGPDKIISAAVPGKEVDLMAFTPSTVPRILQQVDFLNVMTYDLMNRRDTVTKHHSGVSASQAAVDRYLSRGAPPQKLNLGLPYYTKWFSTHECDIGKPLGCPTELLEDPETGADTGKTGGFSWHDPVPPEVANSFNRAKTKGTYDEDGSFYYWDSEERRWWSFDTSDSIKRKFPDVIDHLHLGGVFAWGLGEDAPIFDHFQATIDQVRTRQGSTGENRNRDEL